MVQINNLLKMDEFELKANLIISFSLNYEKGEG